MDLEKQFKKLRPHLKPNSIKTYVSTIQRLKKVDEHLDYRPISSYLKMLPVTNAVTLLTPLIVLEGRTRFGRLYDSLIEDADKMRGQQRLTPTELNNWTSSLEIKKGIKRAKFEVSKLKILTNPRQLKSHDFQILQHLLVLTFYSEFHFRSDLVSIKLGRHKGENYYYDGQIYLNQFKTDKQFNRRGLLPLIYEPSRSLKALLTRFIYIRSLQPEIEHKYLIVNKMSKPVSRNTFYKYMSSIMFKYVGVRIGTSMLRHVYLTEFLSKNPGLEDRKKMLYNMQQLSLETQMSYERKYKPNGEIFKPTTKR
jgi:hypothetical protein